MAKKPTCKELEQRVKELEEESINLKLNLKLIEKELHDKDKHLQSILESADGFAIYRLVVDKENPYLLRPTFVSPSIRNVLGCEPEKFSSLTFFSNIHPDDLARVEQANKQAFETNRFDEICRYYNLIEKQWIWIHAISTGVVNDEGHISHVNGIFIDITEQKKAEESFRRSEEHVRSLMESATNFAVYQFISDETNPHRLKVNYVSPSIKDILGIPEPMKFETWFKHMHPDDMERIAAANQRAFKTFRFDEEYRTYNRKKDEWRWIHAISTGGVDRKEWNRYVNGILMDITDRKQAEEALREREEHFRKLAEGSFEAIVLHNKGVIIEANNQYYEMFGYNPEELAGKDAISLTATPESTENIRKQISLGNLGPYEVTGVKKDGTTFPMEVRIKLTTHKGNKVRMAVIRDLTDRKEMEKELRDAQQKWMSLIENTNDFIMIIDDKGKIQYINRAIPPNTVNQAVGKTLYDFSTPEHHEMIRQAVARVFETREQASYTSSVKHPTGIQWFETTVIPVIEEEKVASAMSFNRIITERKQAEESLRKTYDELEIRVKERTADLSRTNKKLNQEIENRKLAENQISASLREKEVLLREVHHRVKNNFEIISSLLLLSSNHKENKKFQNLCKNARARIYSMALVHDQLYQSDRFDQIDMERHIKELVDYLSQIYERHGKWIATMIEPAEVYLPLNQAIPCAIVLNELIANAFKHAFKRKRKGTVQISIKDSNNDTVLLKVKDDGDCIPKGIGFDNTTSLGLKLVRHLVEGQLNGEMSFGHDNGTEICIEFKKLKRSQTIKP